MRTRILATSCGLVFLPLSGFSEGNQCNRIELSSEKTSDLRQAVLVGCPGLPGCNHQIVVVPLPSAWLGTRQVAWSWVCSLSAVMLGLWIWGHRNY